MAKEKWSKGIDLEEGSLKKLGWPSIDKVVGATSAENRKRVVSKLVYLANVSKDAATKARAKAAINRIKSKLGES